METSDKQAAANRQNARQSTGPRTDEGKAVSARNATRHGLLACVPVLPDEDPAAFAAFEARLVAHLAPVGDLEGLLADRVVSAAWRLRRVDRIEAALLTAHYFDALQADAQAEVARYEENDLDRLLKDEVQVTNATRHAAARRHADAVRVRREAHGEPTLGRAFLRDHEADTVTKLSRYEAALERGLFRTLHELQRLQAMRAGHPVPPPVAVDVTVDHAEG